MPSSVCLSSDETLNLSSAPKGASTSALHIFARHICKEGRCDAALRNVCRGMASSLARVRRRCRRRWTEP